MNLHCPQLEIPIGGIYHLELLGEPQSWKRPIQSRSFNPSRGTQKNMAWQVKAALGYIEKDLTHKWGIRAAFYHKQPMGFRRDVDNLLKNLLDALQMVVFGDDCQVREVFAVCIYDTRPRTELLMYKIGLLDSKPEKKGRRRAADRSSDTLRLI